MGVDAAAVEGLLVGAQGAVVVGWCAKLSNPRDEWVEWADSREERVGRRAESFGERAMVA